MPFTLANYPTATIIPEPAKDPEPLPPVIDQTIIPAIKEQVWDKHDAVKYAMANAPMIGIAGLIAGLQEAYYRFERLPTQISGKSLLQARYVFGPVLQKSALATGLGALFCFTDAFVEKQRGKHDLLGGAIAGGVTGAAFGILRPYPQPFTWPLAFAAAAVSADVVCEHMPKFFGSNSIKTYGPIPGRENWGDPAPPRPPILDTGSSIRPTDGGHFWRGE